MAFLLAPARLLATLPLHCSHSKVAVVVAGLSLAFVTLLGRNPFGKSAEDG